MFWSQPWHTLKNEGVILISWFTKKGKRGPVSWIFFAKGTLLRNTSFARHVTGFVGSSFPDWGIDSGTLAVKAPSGNSLLRKLGWHHCRCLSSAQNTGDGWNESSRQSGSRGNLKKKRKEEKKKSKIQQELFVAIQQKGWERTEY